MSYDRSGGGGFGLIAGAVAIVLGLIFGVWALFNGFDSTGPGEVAVVRNGGPFDKTTIRKVLQPNSGLTNVGLNSTLHRYPGPGQQRYYELRAGGNDTELVDQYTAPTKDGVDAGLDAKLTFELNSGDDAVARAFDDRIGTRVFRCGNTDYHAYDGNDGFGCFLDVLVRAQLEAAVRQQLGNYTCEQLLSSCVLLRDPNAAVDPNAASNSENLSKIQSAIAHQFTTDVREAMGGDFFVAVSFTIQKVALGGGLQDKITDAQKAKAAGAEARAKVAVAQAEADANKAKQDGYLACPACAEIDKLKSIPSNVTVYAPGANTAVPLSK